ncbi:homeobox protein notochord [Canis lupus baileyi]|uniref:Notochord homeobox n=1 Tax=Canis lupus dingo TaxID=286419 RepID=A0A8C0KIF9_CANLU|nr:homeobox protein notochord [Canis lupus dingo]XP_038309396.1 homeobox protein notochord [Canis lupus familiaris]XP_038547651.1 homeobox protein notochord [Canis lupus familiaris]
MPSPAPRARRPPAPPGARDQPPRSGGSRAPRPPALPRRPPGPGTPRAPGRLDSSFSVEAILARPARRAPAAPRPGPAPSGLPATWLPAYLSAGLLQPRPQPPRPGLRLAPCCGLRGLGVTGLELAHCSGFWGTPDWAAAEELQDTERPQKRVRTIFNLKQLEELENVFTKQHNLVGKKRAQLAARLNLTENQVRIWFQNRRVKYQKQQRLKLPAVSAVAAPQDEPSSSSDNSIQREDTESGVDS